ncbi:MAG: hypothetical protein ACM3JG_18735 [Thiohalocapsa sp.]
MQQTTMDRWIEITEARRVCEFAMAERPPVAAPAASLMTKLRAMVIADRARLVAAFGPSTRSPA